MNEYAGWIFMYNNQFHPQLFVACIDFSSRISKNVKLHFSNKMYHYYKLNKNEMLLLGISLVSKFYIIIFSFGNKLLRNLVA